MNSKLQSDKRDNVSCTVKNMHGSEQSSVVQICEWANGEGYDISVDERVFSVTLNEMSAISMLYHYMSIDTQLIDD